jgi:hypothetical protein
MSATAGATAAPARPAAQLPEPGRFWIRYVPRGWPPLGFPWVHLAAARVEELGRAAVPAGARLIAARALEPGEIPPLPEEPLDDVLYLPPVAASRAQARDGLARQRLADGTPVLVQVLPGEEGEGLAGLAAAGAAVVADLLALLLERNLEALESLPAGRLAVWPLLPGLTDDPALWEAGCERLRRAGAGGVQALAPALTPADRRRLSEAWGDDREETFDALFHRDCEGTAERAFAQTAHRFGFAPFLPRPLPGPPIHGGENRRLAGVVALAAELWLRLGRPVEPGQALYRGARWIDKTFYDLGGLAREGNLSVLPTLDDGSRRLVAESVRGEPGLLDELLAEYLALERREKRPAGRGKRRHDG